MIHVKVIGNNWREVYFYQMFTKDVDIYKFVEIYFYVEKAQSCTDIFLLFGSVKITGMKKKWLQNICKYTQYRVIYDTVYDTKIQM